MSVKMMTCSQVNFLRKLVDEKAVPPEEWKKLCDAFRIKKEDDLYHLNVEEASRFIAALCKMPNK